MQSLVRVAVRASYCFAVTASARHLVGSRQVLIGLKGGLTITNRAMFGTVAVTLAGPFELSM